MKPFVFKLQTALNIKLKEEDRVKEELHQLTDRRREALEVMAVLEDELERLEDRLRQFQSASVDVEEIQRCLNYLPVMRGKILNQKEHIRQIEVEIDETRQVLVEIMRKRKVLEKLRERHYAQYQLEYNREEQKAIDEMATNSFNRKDSALL